MGAIGSPTDNAMMESFWSRMQVELLNRQRWKTRIELATAIHDYIELWHNTRRRHSGLRMLTPTEYETLHTTTNQAACLQCDLHATARSRRPPLGWQGQLPCDGGKLTPRRVATADRRLSRVQRVASGVRRLAASSCAST